MKRKTTSKKQTNLQQKHGKKEENTSQVDECDALTSASKNKSDTVNTTVTPLFHEHEKDKYRYIPHASTAFTNLHQSSLQTSSTGSSPISPAPVTRSQLSKATTTATSEELSKTKHHHHYIKKMANNIDNVASLYKELKTEWNKKSCNLQKCGTLLDKLKIELTKLSYLPTTKPSSKQDLVLARDVLEIAVEYSVAKKDIPAFERYISQLKSYYYDYRQIIGESENMYKLLGLNLLYLLSVNRVSEFHTELELLSTDVIRNNPYICPILQLEQYSMEGRYNKIFQAKGSLPGDLFNFFMDNLLETVRDEIGACLEKSYENISLAEAAKRLNLKTKEEVKAFGAKRNWNVGADGIYHFVTKAEKPREPLPAVELAEQVIFYGRELEMIV